MAIKRWNANTSTWELVGTPGTVTPAAIGAAALVGNNILNGSLGIFAGSGRITYNSNNQSLPGSDDGTSANMPFGFGGNLTGGQAEMNIFNNVNLSGTSDGGKGFHFIQKTGASTYEKPLAITGNGYLYQTDILGSRETGLIRNYSTPHVSSNRGASFLVGLNDGSFTGMGVYNVAASNTAYNSQYITFTTHEGGASVAERMRISSTGKVGIGTIPSTGILEILSTDATAPRLINTSNNNNKLMVFEGYAGGLWNLWGGHGGNSYFGISENASSTPVFAITGSTNYVLVGYTASQGAYKLQVNSQIFATSSSIATSDGRYKENVLPITSGLDIIDSLNPVSFNWKEHPVHNFVPGKTVGFIAQEVKESLKDYEWVDNIIKTNTTEAVLDEEGNEITPAEEFLGIAESNIIPLLVAAVKELRSELNTLKASML